VHVRNAVGTRQQQVHPGGQRLPVSAEPLNHEQVLLGDNGEAPVDGWVLPARQTKDKETSNNSSYSISYPSTTHLNSYAKVTMMNQTSDLVGILHSVFSIPGAKHMCHCQLHNMHGKQMKM
jgi:hypothetical protein